MHHPLSPVPLEGRAAVRESEQAIFDAFSDGPLEIAPGESLPATGRRMELPVAWFFEFGADGLVIAERDYFDTATLMSQLGLGS